jgi:hypothetical protein
VYTIGLLSLLGCLPKYLGNQCLNKGKCESFKITGQTPPSEAPFEISRDDIKFETRVNNFQLTERGMLAQTEVRETCRALHLAKKNYVLTQKKWYHKPFKNYILEEDVYINGQYEACSDWKVDNEVNLALRLKSTESKPIVYPIQRSQQHIQIPFSVMGLGMMMAPSNPSLDVQTIETPQPDTFNMTLPERNRDWLCNTIPTIDRIVAKGDFKDWEIHVHVGESKAVMSYIYETEPRLLQLKAEINSCDVSTQKYLQGIIRAAANENPESYGHLNYLYSGLFGRTMTGVQRKATGSRSKTPTTTQRSGSIVGTYQCQHKGQMAFMRIYRNGVFSLKLELESGSAQGLCKGNTCTVESINNNAIAFTGSVNSFAIKRTGNSLMINNSVRCEKKS